MNKNFTFSTSDTIKKTTKTKQKNNENIQKHLMICFHYIPKI